MNVGATATMTGVPPQPIPFTVKVMQGNEKEKDDVPGPIGFLPHPMSMPASAGYPPQAIHITVNMTPEKEKKKEKKEEKSAYTPEAEFYVAIDLLKHAAVISRKVIGCETSCQPIYRATYGVALTAGALFGVYKAYAGSKPCRDIAKRANVFTEGSLTKKLWVIADQVSLKAGGFLFAEQFQLADNLSAGNLAAIYWGFKLGDEAAGFAYKNLISSETKKEG